MRWKTILGIVVGSAVAAIVAIFVILSSYDFNDLKPQRSPEPPRRPRPGNPLASARGSSPKTLSLWSR
ncbi:MAG: hypothetical protein ACUVXD_14435 [Thermodesulfobacteriota bacterium]